MSTVWKINGTPVDALRATGLLLRLTNQAPDTLTFTRSVEAASGDGYLTAPTVSFTGGGGTGAAATATIADGAVDTLTLTAGGTGYTSAPTVVFSGGGTAAATAVLTPTTLASVALTAGGSGYTSEPAVAVVGGGGTGAVVTAQLAARGVGGIAVTNGGTGYASAPTVSLSGGGGTGATAVAVLTAGAVSAIALTNGGSGYTSAPTVVLTGGGGTGAAALAELAPTSIGSVAVTAGGTYGAQSTIASSLGQIACFAIDGAGRLYFGLASSGANTALDIYRLTPGGSPVVFASIPDGFGFGGVEGLAFDNDGDLWIGEWEAGELFRVGPGGGTATDIRTLAGSVGGMTRGADGHLYITIYTTGVVQKYVVATDTLTTFASGLSSPIGICADAAGNLYVAQWTSSQLKKITSGGSVSDFANIGASATDVALASDGQLYALSWGNNLQVVSPTGVATPYFAGSGITQPLALTANSAGVLYVAGVAASGSIIQIGVRPSVTLAGGGGTGGAASARMSGGSTNTISNIVVDAGGSGYTSAPSVAISGSGGGAATASLTAGPVAAVNVTAGGSGYSSAPSVAFTGGGGTGAAATASVSTIVSAINVTNAGSGYTSAPTVSLSGGGGTGAAGTATLLPAAVASLTLTSPGSGFTGAPTLAFSGGGGSGAAGTVLLTPTSVASLVLTSPGGGLHLDDQVVLTRTEGAGDPVTWFRGRLRAAPRRLTPSSETLRFEVLGPWHWLERTPYLQSWKTPADPDDTESALVDYLRGRAILNQDPAGEKITAKVFLEELLDYAIDACTAANGGIAPFAFVVDTSLAVTLPWDEVTDLSCADAIGRILSILPDTVAWVDYAPTTPVIYLSRRAELAALEIPVLPPGDNSAFAHARRGEIDLAPLAEQRRTKVVLIYVSTHRANEASWETYAIDAYPPASAPNDPNALVRTIQLAGGIVSGTFLMQKVDVDVIPAALLVGDAGAVVLTAGSDFDTLSAWWKKHAPDLKKSNVTIKAIRARYRTLTDGASALVENPPNELIKGAVTDWMETKYDIVVEDQLVQAQIDVEITDPADATKKERQIWPMSVVIRATDAATQTYNFSEGIVATPPEEVPTGLAEQIYNAISPLHYEGGLVLTEAEPTVNALVGRALNLTGDLTAWETMAALVQSAAISIDDGRTQLRVGPPRHLGVGDLIDLFRANRTRRPVTGFETRTSGRSGGNGGNQGLSYHLPAALVASRQAPPPRVLTKAMTVAGVVPTSGEVQTALASGWTSPDHPIAGDTIIVTVGGTPKLKYRITLTNIGTSGLGSVSFTVSSVTYYGLLTQIGIY